MIRGFFSQHAPSHPYVRATVLLPDFMERPAPVHFMIDTGSAFTAVQPLDAVHRLKLPSRELVPGNWPPGERAAVVGIGGTVSFRLVQARVTFFDDRTGPRVFESRVCLAAGGSHSPRIPSLLGWDLLRHFRLRIDGPARSVALELP